MNASALGPYPFILMSSHPSSPNIGRFTGVVLGLVVFVCVTMIGGTGYLKYQLDVAETTLAAPDNALGGGQEMFDRLRRDLGYGGFLGLAQAYVSTHDASGFAEMKAHVKSADEIVAHLPDKTPAETRHELTAIAAVFDEALRKISAPPGEMVGEFTAADLAPLYAALPILDARVASASSEARLAAQNKMQFWAMLLTLASWCSLIIAAACAAGIYLTLRDKHSAPMRALAQSIQNMSRGDMRTAIWGTERQDVIGELARAVDIARYHFSHLPDLSLLSEQGPIRLRFEGGTRSLFEAMMKAISGDSENIREQSAALTHAVKQQKENISVIAEKVEVVLKNVLEHGQNGDQQIRQAIHGMIGSAEGLRNAHAHAADQLNRLIPHIQERASNMSEIAAIAGKQIGQTIQSLAASEIGMKTNAEHANTTLIKLAETADNLGERLFGAINLLQASGKVMAETVEQIKGRFGDEAPAQVQQVDLTPLSQGLEEIMGRLASLQAKMERPAEDRSGAMPDIGELIASHIAPKFEAIAQRVAQHNVDSAIKTNTALMEMGEKIEALTTGLPAELRQNLQEDLKGLSASIDMDGISEKIGDLSAKMNGELRQGLQEDLQRLAAQIDVAALGEKILMLQAGLEKTVGLPLEITERMGDLWGQLAAQIEASRASLDQALHRDVSDRLGAFEESLAATRIAVETAQAEMSRPAPKLAYSLPPELQKQMFDQWTQMSAQIEASRTSLVGAISEQIDKMENRLAGRNSASLSRTAADYATQRQIEQQTQILSELVATLGVIDEHMRQLKSEMHVAADRAQA